MPDGLTPTGRGPRTTIADLDSELLSRGEDVRRLSPTELAKYGVGKFVAGWHLDLQTDVAGRRRINLLIDRSFPYSLPVVMLLNGPGLNIWPHVEANGKLCLWPSGTRLCDRAADDIVDQTLWDACRLIDDSASGINREDLRAEFHSYWSQAASPGSRDLLSLIRPDGPTRSIFVGGTRRFTVVADNEKELRRWLGNFTASPDDAFSITRGVFAWIGQPLLPVDYPNSATSLKTLLDRMAPAACPMVNEIASSVPDKLPVILGARAATGPCLAAVVLTKGKVPVSGQKRQTTHAERGFRHDHVPPAIASQRWLGTASFERATVERADAEWVHGRDHNPRTVHLRGLKVIILGCGSLGSAIALNLAQTGVGNLVMIDPQIMGAANVGRHILGADAIGQSKALALASLLKRRYPHLGSCQGVLLKWQDALTADPALFEGCDLVISAIGEWSHEGPLNEWHITSGRGVPVMYAWTEPHACAGHAVVIGASGGCLACGFHGDGTPICEATDWPVGPVVIPEPACGAFFTPYGPVELSNVTNLASELALDVLAGEAMASDHRIWVARRKHLEAVGGQWATSWLIENPGRDQGGYLADRRWPSGPCAVCG